MLPAPLLWMAAEGRLIIQAGEAASITTPKKAYPYPILSRTPFLEILKKGSYYGYGIGNSFLNQMMEIDKKMRHVAISLPSASVEKGITNAIPIVGSLFQNFPKKGPA